MPGSLSPAAHTALPSLHSDSPAHVTPIFQQPSSKLWKLGLRTFALGCGKQVLWSKSRKFVRELRTENCEQVSWQVCLRQVSKRRIAWAASRPVARSHHLAQITPGRTAAASNQLVCPLPTRHKPSSKPLLHGEQGKLSL